MFLQFQAFASNACIYKNKLSFALNCSLMSSCELIFFFLLLNDFFLWEPYFSQNFSILIFLSRLSINSERFLITYRRSTFYYFTTFFHSFNFNSFNLSSLTNLLCGFLVLHFTYLYFTSSSFCRYLLLTFGCDLCLKLYCIQLFPNYFVSLKVLLLYLFFLYDSGYCFVKRRVFFGVFEALLRE